MDKKEVLLERNKISRLLGTQSEDDSLERNIFLLESLGRQKDIVDIIGKVYVLIKERHDSQALEDIRNEICGLIGTLENTGSFLVKLIILGLKVRDVYRNLLVCFRLRLARLSSSKSIFNKSVKNIILSFLVAYQSVTEETST